MELISGRKISVVVDAAGEILAAGPRPEDVAQPDPDGPRYLGFLPMDDQEVHEIEFPAVTSLEEFQRVQATHRVRVIDGKARLEPR